MALTEEIGALVAKQPGTYTLYARNLTTGEAVEIDADRVMPTESAIKTCILLYYSRQVDTRVVDPDQLVTLDDTDRLWGTGVLRHLHAGLTVTLNDLAWLMIVVSDNVATALLLQSIGSPDALNESIRALGIGTTRMNPEITMERALEGEAIATSSARDLAEVYTRLDERCRTMLFRQQHLIGLPRRLPHAADASDVGIDMPVRVYNKTGNGIGTFIDSGLFETDAASWVVAAMASDQPDFASRADDLAPTTFGAIGELLYNAWGNARA